VEKLYSPSVSRLQTLRLCQMGFQILRNKKRRLFQYSIASFVVYINTALAASTGVTHGTYFAIYPSSDYVVVAIDSRRREDSSNGATKFFDDKCKVVPLSDGAIFIATGIISNSDFRAPIFDGFTSAPTAFARARQTHSLEESAMFWAQDIRPKLEALYPFYPALFNSRPNGEILHGYFIGFDFGGELASFDAKILHNLPGPFTLEVTPLPRDLFTLGGYKAEVQEFISGITPRAAAIQRQIQTESTGKSIVEKRMIEIKHLVIEVPQWTNDEEVGGDIAQVIFESTAKGWRWYNRPNFCPEH
jgi:hypothetical protein